MAVQIKVQPDLKHKPVPKVGTFEVDWEISKNPRLLNRVIKEKTQAFIRAMELRGMTLYRKTPPKVVTHPDGEPMAFYAIDWIGTPEVAPDGGEMPKTRATSLEESKGRVEYRISEEPDAVRLRANRFRVSLRAAPGRGRSETSQRTRAWVTQRSGTWRRVA